MTFEYNGLSPPQTIIFVPVRLSFSFSFSSLALLRSDRGDGLSMRRALPAFSRQSHCVLTCLFKYHPSRCRDYVASPYLIHFFHSTSKAERGSQVPSNTLTSNFRKIRNMTDIDWGEGTPASFHEQRSLSERLYSEQGVNTKDLLGHKSQKQTDRYHDDRGKDWVKVAI